MRYKLCIPFLFSIHICWSRLEVDKSLYRMGIVNYQPPWERRFHLQMGQRNPALGFSCSLEPTVHRLRLWLFSYRKLINWTYQISSTAGRESICFVSPHKLCKVVLWLFNSKKHEGHYKGKDLFLRLAIHKSPTMPSKSKSVNQLFFSPSTFYFLASSNQK